MKISKILLITFMLFQPIFFITLLLLKNRIPNYEIPTHVVSLLGAQEKPYRTIFNIEMIVYGLLGLGLPLSIIKSKDKNIFYWIFLIGLFISCFGSILVGIFPMDTQQFVHEISAYIVFFGIFLSGTFFIPFAIKKFTIKSVIIGIIVISIITIITVIFLLIYYLDKNLYHSLPEWTCVPLACLWNFFVSTTLLKVNKGI